MATKTKEQTPLETAQEELTALKERLDRSQRNKAKLSEELNQLWQQRTSHAAITTPETQRRCVELKSLIADEADVAEALTRKMEEHQVTVQALTREQQRNDAAAACRAVEAEFAQLVQAIGSVPLEAWLVKASSIHSAFFAANGTQNMKIERMRAGLGDLVQRVKTLQTL